MKINILDEIYCLSKFFFFLFYVGDYILAPSGLVSMTLLCGIEVEFIMEEMGFVF